MKLSLLIRLLLVGLVAVSLIEVVFQKCLSITDDTKNVFIGLFTSSIVVLLIELINYFYDKKTLSKLEGKYIRIKITNWNSDKGEHDDITEQCKKNDITLNYRGEGEYVGTAHYKDGEVGLTINLDKANPNVGKGIYQYRNNDDLGTYGIQLDKNNSDRIFISYSNVISSNSIKSGQAHGYEIWKRIEKHQR